jgi:hypothetical protein
MKPTRTKKLTAMDDKHFRDLQKIAKTLVNRKNNDMLRAFVSTAVELSFVSDGQAEKILQGIEKGNIGSFNFFAESRHDASCYRCQEAKIKKGNPVCIAFNEKPFCLECLTDGEKAFPNPYYAKYMGIDLKKQYRIEEATTTSEALTDEEFGVFGSDITDTDEFDPFCSGERMKRAASGDGD